MIYRREIDGLRGLAVVPVILFHAGFSWFQGGFVGVDVFFVISGYLITTLILSEKQTGTFSIVRFYERRARRILPALVLVIIACLPAAWAWMLPTELTTFFGGVVAVSVFLANRFFQSDTGYFGGAVEAKPLLHTWSLGVEEQFYVLFPPAILLLWWVSRRWLVAAVALVAAASLAFAQWSGNLRGSPPFIDATWSWMNVPAWAFYSTPARAWELLVGALAAYFMKGQAPSKTRTNQVVSVTGFALVVLAMAFFDEATPTPSLYTFLPVAGTAIIVMTAARDTLIGAWLSSPLIVGIGTVSYSAYLWHQPLFAFARLRDLDEPGAATIVALIGVTFILAYLSWKFVEKPFRDRSRFTSRQIFGAAAVASIGLFAIGWFGQGAEGFESRWHLPTDVKASLGGNVRLAGCFKTNWYCDVAANGAPHSFVLFGDSHAFSLFPAFEKAANELGVNGVMTGSGGCAPFMGFPTLQNDQLARGCREMNARVFDYVKHHDLRKIFLVGRWTYYADRGHVSDNLSHMLFPRRAQARRDVLRDAFRQGLENTLSAYANIGTSVYLVQQVPEQAISAERLYYATYTKGLDVAKTVRERSIDTSDHLELQRHVRMVFARLAPRWNTALVDLDALCSQGKCPIGTERQSFYSDSNHLSNAGAVLLEPTIRKYLQ